MKKILIILGIIILALAIVFSLRFIIGGPEDDWICANGDWVKHGVPSAPKPEGSCGRRMECTEYLPENCPGECVVCPPCMACSSISCQTEEFCAGLGIGRDWYENIEKAIKNFAECAAAGNAIMESYPRQCRAGGQTFVEDIGNELEKMDLIRIDSPRPNESIKSPLKITGQARGNWFFEADFPIRLLDEDGSDLGQAIGEAKGQWMAEDFVPFSAELEFTAPKGKTGLLILKKDNPSGLPENNDALRVPIIFGPTAEKMKIKVYFNNSKLDPEFSCNKVFPVEREIAKTEAVARAALEELLKGATEEEKANGFFSNINPGVKIQSLSIENGVARVDFNEQMEFQIGGSCRVAAISAQIRETLKQFSTVGEVVISINGRTEDILQP